jgi:NitT/TauT family transport system ATP-binding protein
MHFTCERLSKTYRHRRGTTAALSDVSFHVDAGEFVCLVGPSGCGKTTLLKLIAGLLDASSGQVAFDNEPDDGRPRTALVFQEHGLFPWMTVVDNVAFGLKMRGVDRAERRARASAFLDAVGLSSCG